MIRTRVLAGSLLEDLLIRGDLSLTVILGIKHLSGIDVEESMGMHRVWMEPIEQYAPDSRAKSFHG